MFFLLIQLLNTSFSLAFEANWDSIRKVDAAAPSVVGLPNYPKAPSIYFYENICIVCGLEFGETSLLS